MNEMVTVDARLPAQRVSITAAMARHYEMEPDTFMATMRATVFAKGMSREEEAAFLLVAKHHNLNPVTREIYAMPKKGGGIIPVVSIDGWVRMANEHPAFDGMEFGDAHDGEGKLVSTTCRIYRKDRSHPVVVTEYLVECKRDTEPWKMQHRMLRHKSMIQCARYAFGFAGIYDPDEAERFAEPLGANTSRRLAPSPSASMIEHSLPQQDTRENDVAPAPAAEKPQEARRAPSPTQARPEASKAAPALPYDPEALRKRFEAAAKKSSDVDQLNEAWESIVAPHWDGDLLPPDAEDLDRLYKLRSAELTGEEGAEP